MDKSSFFFLNLILFCIYSQVGSKTKLEKAKITLNDCLACSGCITSAESVLITQQSHEELFKVLQNNKVQVVTSVYSYESTSSFSLCNRSVNICVSD